MATERKPVYFNVSDPVEREMWELVKTLNFSGWVKQQLRPLVQARCNTQVKKGVGVPVPDGLPFKVFQVRSIGDLVN